MSSSWQSPARAENKNYSRAISLLVAGFFLLPAGKIIANGFALPDQDAFASARGDAFVATADNASAVFYNPAGLTQLAGNNVRGGLEGIYYDPAYQSPDDGKKFHSPDNFGVIPQIFFAHTMKERRVTFGLGLYSPFGGKITWPQDTGFRSVSVNGSLKYFTINPVVAFEVAPGLSVGGGLMLNYASIHFEQGLREAFMAPNINFFRFEGDGWSVGYNAGIRWQPMPQFSLGATLRSGAMMQFKGRTEFEQDLAGIPDTTRNAQTRFNFPLTAIFGISYRPTPKWNLEFDANFTDWDSFGAMNLQQSSPPPPLKSNVPIRLDWRSSWMYEVGVTRYFPRGWQASAGFVFNENSVPDSYYTPLAEDLDRNLLSIGFGHKGKKIDFDIAYQLGFAFDRTVSGSTPSSTPGQFSGQSADGKYGFSSSALMVSVGLHF